MSIKKAPKKTDEDPLFNCDQNEWMVISSSSSSSNNQNIIQGTNCVTSDDCDSYDNSSTSSITADNYITSSSGTTNYNQVIINDNTANGILITTPMMTPNIMNKSKDCIDDTPEMYFNEDHNKITLPLHPHTEHTKRNNAKLMLNNNLANSKKKISSSSSSSLSSSIASDDFAFLNNSQGHQQTIITNMHHHHHQPKLTKSFHTAVEECISIHSASLSQSSSSSSLKYDECTLVEHIILPNETLQGLTLQYKVSATRLRQLNKFSGSNLSFAPKKLVIPIKKINMNGGNCISGIRLQDVNTQEYKIHKVLAECPGMRRKEVEAYLELHNGDIHKTISSIQADTEWEQGSNRSLNECKTSFEPPSTSLYEFNNDQVNIKLRLINSDTDQNFRYDGMKGETNASMSNANKLYELKATKDAAERWEELSHPGSYKSVIDNSQPIPRFDFETVVNKQREAKHVATLENYHKAPPIDYGIEMKDFGSSISSLPQSATTTR